MFQIDNKSDKSIVQQIEENYKNLIIKEELLADEKIMSVRELSKSIGVNPNTVQKAYKRLEEGKYIYVVKGKGTFVSKEYSKETNQKEIDDAKKIIEDGISKIFFAGGDKTVVRNIVENIIEKKGEWF